MSGSIVCHTEVCYMDIYLKYEVCYCWLTTLEWSFSTNEQNGNTKRLQRSLDIFGTSTEKSMILNYKEQHIILLQGFIGYNGLTSWELTDSGIIKEHAVSMGLESTERSTQPSEANINTRYEYDALLTKGVMLHMRLAYEYVCVKENIDILDIGLEY